MITPNQLQATSRLSYLQGYAEGMRINGPDEFRDVWEMFATELELVLAKLYDDMVEDTNSHFLVPTP